MTLLSYSLAPTDDPAFEAVTLAEARAQTRVTHTGDDALLEDQLIPAAREQLERDTGLAIVQRPYRLTLDQFPACDYIEVPKAPLLSVESVTYQDGDDQQQTLSPDDYRVDTGRRPGVLILDHDQTWPATRAGRNAVAIDFTAGPASAAAAPKLAKQAILMLVAHWYEHPEAEVMGTISTEVRLGYERIVRLLLGGRYP